MAAKYGLQASFLWAGVERPVVDIIDELLDQAQEGLATLGATRNDLPLLQTMLQRRRCQADFVLDLAQRYSDPYRLASAHAKLVRDWEVFDNYVVSAPPLDPVPVPSEAEVREEHLARIGEGTHFYELRDAMYYPPTLVEQMIDDFIENGLIHADATPRGLLLTRCQGNHLLS
jgi:hypothetical protein